MPAIETTVHRLRDRPQAARSGRRHARRGRRRGALRGEQDRPPLLGPFAEQVVERVLHEGVEAVGRPALLGLLAVLPVTDVLVEEPTLDDLFRAYYVAGGAS